MVLAVLIPLVASCPGQAESNTYFFDPSNADGIYPAFKFPIGEIRGNVTSATLFVSPAAFPISNLAIHLFGGESNTPILHDSISDWTEIGTRYLPESMRYYEAAGLDVTDFVRTAKSPYVQIDVFSYWNVFRDNARLQVITFVPEPSSLVSLTIGVGALLTTGRFKCRVGQVL